MEGNLQRAVLYCTLRNPTHRVIVEAASEKWNSKFQCLAVQVHCRVQPLVNTGDAWEVWVRSMVGGGMGWDGW